MNNEYLEKLAKKLKNDGEARFARKALAYYDGEQEEEMRKFLNAPNSFRKHWNKKGQSIRTRNLVKKIVDASGLLFNDSLPKFEVWDNGAPSEQLTQSFTDIFNEANGTEFFSNFDNMVRLLKSGAVLVQYDEATNRFYFDHLNVGTCVGRTDPVTRELTEIVYSSDEDADEAFRYMSPEVVIDFELTTTGVNIISSVPNTLGFIPLAIFHDTHTPRCGLWNTTPTELVGLNEAYNAYLMDVEYAGAWQTVSTLFTTANLEPTQLSSNDTFDRMASRTVTDSTGKKVAATTSPQTTSEVIGGPGQIVRAHVKSGESAVFEYKSPQGDINSISAVFAAMTKDFAADWSVRFSEGSSVASSGFQLLVEEMPNLELRKARQRMFEAGFKRLYAVMKRIVPTLSGELFTVFSDPALPVNQADEEVVWSRRIQEGRASRVDYFMATQGLSEQEALAKIAKIDAFNANNPQASTRKIVVNGTASTNAG